MESRFPNLEDYELNQQRGEEAARNSGQDEKERNIMQHYNIGGPTENIN